MSQIASKQIVFLIIILRIVHAYIVYQLLLIFVKLPPPTLSANVRPQAAIMGSSYDQWSMMMIKLLCTCLTLAGYCLHKNAVCTNLPGYVCKREPLLYHLVASNGNVYKQFVASCLGEEVVNAANVYKGPNVHSIKTRSFAQINTPNLPPNGVACPGEC